MRAKKDMDDLQAILNTVPANATGQEDLNQDGNEKCLTLCFEITKWPTLLKRSKMFLQRDAEMEITYRNIDFGRYLLSL